MIRERYRAFSLSLLFLGSSQVACSKDEPEGTPVKDNPCEDIPLESEGSMSSWVRGGDYEEWPAEPEIHDSAGPHFGNVRTWVSPELATSLEDGNTSHPLCSASVKELYGEGTDVRGWAVSVKVADNGNSSDWYWYELYDGETFAAGVDAETCTGCHSSGDDFIRTAPPFE